MVVLKKEENKPLKEASMIEKNTIQTLLLNLATLKGIQ